MPVAISLIRSLLITAVVFSFAEVSFADHEGTYIVPKGERLAEEVTFKIERVQFRENGRSARLQYSLPFELDGTSPHQFDLKGSFKNGAWRMYSEDQKAFGVCTGNEAQFTCRMKYATNENGVFPLNIESANSYLTSRTDLSREQIEQFQLAQDVFSHEPIGLVIGRRN